jgi:hypothetical protein
MIHIIFKSVIIIILHITLNLYATTIVVISNANSGPGTLRQAILDVSSKDEILFDPAIFSLSVPGVIYLTNPLPFIVHDTITINASNSGVVLDGSMINIDASGIHINSNENWITGLEIRGFHDGISIAPGQSYNIIGGFNNGEGNYIYNNTNNGITVGDGAISNAFISNMIFANGNLGIDLGNDGVTPNDITDADSGANMLQNFPVITSLSLDENDSLSITYHVDSDPEYSYYPLHIQFFQGNNTHQPAGYYNLWDQYTETDYNNGAKNYIFDSASELGFAVGDSMISTATDSLRNTSEYSPVSVITTITALKTDHQILNRMKLYQNYPNPFNPSTKITFTLAKSEYVTLYVYNTLGQKVETRLDTKMTAGSHDVEFNASDLPSGIYFYRIQAGEFSRVKKMVLLR